VGKQEIFTILMGKYVGKVTTLMIKIKLEHNKRRIPQKWSLRMVGGWKWFKIVYGFNHTEPVVCYHRA